MKKKKPEQNMNGEVIFTKKKYNINRKREKEKNNVSCRLCITEKRKENKSKVDTL